ncbi:unnamed protein product, partial [Prorocentrum cordatum]
MARATALAVCAQASTGAGNAIARGLAHRHLCAAPDFVLVAQPPLPRLPGVPQCFLPFVSECELPDLSELQAEEAVPEGPSPRAAAAAPEPTATPEVAQETSAPGSGGAAWGAWLAELALLGFNLLFLGLQVIRVVVVNGCSRLWAAAAPAAPALLLSTPDLDVYQEDYGRGSLDILAVRYGASRRDRCGIDPVQTYGFRRRLTAADEKVISAALTQVADEEYLARETAARRPPVLPGSGALLLFDFSQLAAAAGAIVPAGPAAPGAPEAAGLAGVAPALGPALGAPGLAGAALGAPVAAPPPAAAGAGAGAATGGAAGAVPGLFAAPAAAEW